MVVILWLLVASNDKASVLKLLLCVVAVPLLYCAWCAVCAVAFVANQAVFAGSENGEAPLRHGVCVRQLNILLALNEIIQ
jgi:hypothetical protein